MQCPLCLHLLVPLPLCCLPLSVCLFFSKLSLCLLLVVVSSLAAAGLCLLYFLHVDPIVLNALIIGYRYGQPLIFPKAQMSTLHVTEARAELQQAQHRISQLEKQLAPVKRQLLAEQQRQTAEAAPLIERLRIKDDALKAKQQQASSCSAAPLQPRPHQLHLPLLSRLHQQAALRRRSVSSASLLL